jgi:hypothetical protein
MNGICCGNIIYHAQLRISFVIFTYERTTGTESGKIRPKDS